MKAVNLILVVTVMLGLLACNPVVQKTSQAAQAGHWEGEPSVSFDVTADGDIRNFKIKAPFGALAGQTCTIETEEIEIGADGKFVVGEPEDAPFHITAEFSDATHLVGTYKIAVCSDGDQYSVVLQPEEKRWSAEWAGPATADEGAVARATEPPVSPATVEVPTSTPTPNTPTPTPNTPTPTSESFPTWTAASTEPPLPVASWQPLPDLPRAINALVADPTNPQVLFAGTGESGAGSGVYKSEDAGLTWVRASEGLPSEDVHALAFSLDEPAVLYAAVGHHDVFASSDGGQSWTRVGAPDLAASSERWLLVAPSDGNVLFTITSHRGIRRSDDGGRNWRAVEQGLPQGSGDAPSIQSLAIDPNDPNVVYLGTGWGSSGGNGVYKSTDGGATWAATNRGMIDYGITALAIDPANAQVVYAGGAGGELFKSTDGGQNWADLTAALSLPEHGRGAVVEIVVAEGAAGTVYALVERVGVLASDDGGESWRVLGKPGALDYPTFTAMTAIPGTFILGVRGEGGWRYGADQSVPVPTPTPQIGAAPTFPTPRPGSWQPLPDLPRQINALLTDPTNLQILYAGTGTSGAGSGVYKSEDGGLTWQLASDGLPGEDVRALAWASSDPATLLAAVGHGGDVYASSDGASSWSRIGSYDLSGFKAQWAVAPSAPNVLFVAEDVRGLYRSLDGGRNWQMVDEGLPADADGTVSVPSVAVDPTDANVIYAGTGWSAFNANGVYKSTDGGATWSPANRGMLDRSITALAISPANAQIVFAGTNEGELFESADGGTNWSRLSTGLPDHTQIVQIILDPTLPDTVYLLGDHVGVLASYDGGGNWRVLGKPGELDYPSFTAMTMIPGLAPVLVVGIRDEGGWRYAAD